MRRLHPLPRIRRDPEALKLAISRKRTQRQNTAREQRELEISMAHVLRREVRATGPAIIEEQHT